MNSPSYVFCSVGTKIIKFGKPRLFLSSQDSSLRSKIVKVKLVKDVIFLLFFFSLHLDCGSPMQKMHAEHILLNN